MNRAEQKILCMPLPVKLGLLSYLPMADGNTFLHERIRIISSTPALSVSIVESCIQLHYLTSYLPCQTIRKFSFTKNTEFLR